jgi:hypothetical protein
VQIIGDMPEEKRNDEEFLSKIEDEIVDRDSYRHRIYGLNQ